jgi:glycosyltransferase involved in cell wall biosynthesis
MTDRSPDATPQILDQFARENKNLKAIHVRGLPRGWLGKSYAMVKAYQHAAGDWLVLADADIRFAPDLLRRSPGLVKSKRWDHLSGLNLGALVTPKSRRYSGSRAFQLLRRAAYGRIGTHQRLAMEIVEDIKLGKLVKQSGFRSGVALSGDMVRLRWHQGLGGIVKGLTNIRRNLLSFFSVSMLNRFRCKVQRRFCYVETRRSRTDPETLRSSPRRNDAEGARLVLS